MANAQMSDDEILARAAAIKADRAEAYRVAAAAAADALKAIVTTPEFAAIAGQLKDLAHVTPLDNEVTYVAGVMKRLVDRFPTA